VVLQILPFEQILLEVGNRAPLRATWWRRTLSLPLRMTNLGNAPIQVAVQGKAGTERLVFRPGQADVPCTVQPGQQVRTVVALTARRLPLLGARPCFFGLQAVDQEGRVLQQLRQSVELRPLLGTWQLVAAGSLALAGAGAALLLLLLAALLLQISVQTPSGTPPAAPAPAVIVVALDQPATPPPPAAPLERLSSTEPDPALPLVLPDQVSVPANGGALRGSAAPASPQRPSSPAGTGLTYAQLFQQVGAEYDLDWRMLAAQAYVESSFDTLALSSAGAMGLMQILPATWREWAPAVSASDPFDSLSNVQVAAVYLDFLRGQLAQRGYAEVAWTLVAYHWGIDRLLDFLNSGGTWQELPEPRRRYAEEILRIAQTLP
jgi:soluble lytic murein transglycosylase-like protein